MGGTNGRIEGLDAWRAMLMLGGLLVHGSFRLPNAPLFAIVVATSQAFRMGAFFAIAGFLTARALSSRPPKAWLRGRLIQLIVPLAFGITVLSPFIWMTRLPPASGNGELTGPFNWHHLWFLVGLILYSVAALTLSTLDRRHALTERLVAAQASCRISMSVIFGLVAVASVSAMLLTQAIMPHEMEIAMPNLHFIPAYFPVFVLGLALGREPDLCAAAVASWRGSAVTLASVAALYLLWFAAGGAWAVSPAIEQAGVVLAIVAVGLCPTAAFVLILRSSLATRRVPTVMRDLSDASYTIYLLHLPIIALLNGRVLDASWHPYARYVVSILASFALSYMVHRFGVRRSRALALLLNGKANRWTPPALAPATS